MKLHVIICWCIASVLCTSIAHTQQTPVDPLKRMADQALALFDTVQPVPFIRTDHPNAQWFPEAGFGLFMHWGIHSVGAVQPSWAMMEGYPYGTDKSEYWGKGYYDQQLTKFNPQSYDPDKWMKAAAEAGMTYAVLTAKHHDGYALWPSEYGQLSTKQYMGGRDLLKPYVDACRKYGLKVGLYFSPRDWGYPGYPQTMKYTEPYRFPEGWTKEQNQKAYIAFFRYTIGQLSEILTRYGKIDVIWFDGMGWEGATDIRTEQVLAWVRLLQPAILINPRWGDTGDFETPEWNLPDGPPEGWWENCISWSGHWGYSPDTDFQHNTWVMERLITCRAWDGNLLLNIGPAPDGAMRPEYYTQLAEIAGWMKTGRESLIGSRGVRNWKSFSTVPITRSNGIWYLHVLPDFKGDIRVTDVPKPRAVKLLRTGTALDTGYTQRALTITLPAAGRNTLDEVIAIYWDAEPAIGK